MLATYTDNGVFVMPGVGTFTGRAELAKTYEGWKPRAPQRHMIMNTLVTSWSDDAAASISDVVFVAKGKDGTWGVQFVARYHDTFRHVDGRWLFARREVESA